MFSLFPDRLRKELKGMRKQLAERSSGSDSPLTSSSPSSEPMNPGINRTLSDEISTARPGEARTEYVEQQDETDNHACVVM
jgi:hypothetical protein